MNRPFKVISAQIIHIVGDTFNVDPMEDNDLHFKTLEEAKNYINDLKREKKGNGFPLIVVEEISHNLKKLVYIDDT